MRAGIENAPVHADAAVRVDTLPVIAVSLVLI
jgi:hypothetical protein